MKKWAATRSNQKKLNLFFLFFSTYPGFKLVFYKPNIVEDQLII